MSHKGRPTVALVILAGSDGKPTPVPEGGEDFHFVVGYKGTELRVGDRCLAQLLVDRVRESDVFAEIYLVGPERLYAGLVDCPIVDSDGNLGENIRAGVSHVLLRHGREAPVAFMACDILPGPGEISRLATELLVLLEERESDGGSGPALVLSVVDAGKDLGASEWKPTYRIRPEAGVDPVALLPGHLGIARPSMLRMGLLYRLVQLFYEERNRDYDERRRVIVLRIFGTLLKRDLQNILRLQPPTLTFRVLRHGLRTFLLWRRGNLDLEGLADTVANLSVRRKHYRRQGASSVRYVITPLLAFAKDIDTHEELRELARKITSAE